MRLWHKDLIAALPKAQLVSQWRECCAISRSLAERGSPNHLLVNKILEYDINHFRCYINIVLQELEKRHIKTTKTAILNCKFNLEIYAEETNQTLDRLIFSPDLFPQWHDKEYLRICMANLAEKHFYGVGASQITDDEWDFLRSRYEEITGEDYRI